MSSVRSISFHSISESAWALLRVLTYVTLGRQDRLGTTECPQRVEIERHADGGVLVADGPPKRVGVGHRDAADGGLKGFVRPDGSLAYRESDGDLCVLEVSQEIHPVDLAIEVSDEESEPRIPATISPNLDMASSLSALVIIATPHWYCTVERA
jgi:hypothetical protein